MSKILNLPTSKDTNWGGTLNSYLEQLNNRIENLEIERQEVTDKYNSIANIGYASTGLVGGNNEITYNEDKEEIKFKGSVYISGGINRYFKIEDYITKDLSTLNIKTCYFILLSYNESLGFEIISSPEEDFDYTKILLGFYYNNKFVKYYYSSLKNVVQHQYELNNSWIDLDTNQNSIVVTLENNNVTANISNKYRLYCDGIGANNLIDIMSTSNYIDVKPNGNVIYLLDEIDANNKIITTRGANSNIDLTADKGNYYRMLLDIFGNIYIQKSVINTRIETERTSWSTQQLYNAKFNNNIPEITASLWVEAARFGFNGNFFKTYSSYVYQQFDTEYNNDFIFVKALDRGVINQQAANVWITQDSEIRLNKVTFKNDANSSHGFKFNYIDNEDGLDKIININRSILSSDNPTILWANTRYENSTISLETDVSTILLNNNSSSEKRGIEIYSNKDIDIISKDTIKLKSNEFYITDGVKDFIKYTVNGGTELSFYSTNYQQANPYTFYTEEYDEIYNKLKLKCGDKKEISLDLSSTEPKLNIEVVDTYASNIYLKEGSEIKFTSDRRRKENFAPIKDSYLDIVLNTPVLNYHYKGSKKQQVGIIAQDLENAVKNNIDCFVSKEDTIELKDKRSLNETKLIYILWKSIQEQNDCIQKLEKRLNDLERNL